MKVDLLAGTGTGTKTSSNSFNISRMNLICRQIEVLLKDLMNWKPDKIHRLMYAINNKYLTNITLRAVDDDNYCYGVIEYDLDWKKHESLLITNGNMLLVKKKYEESLPETKALVDGMKDLMSEMNLHMEIFFNIVDSCKAEFSKLFNTVPAQEIPHVIGESANFNTKIIPEVNANLCISCEKTFKCSVCGNFTNESNCIRTYCIGDIVCFECAELARSYDISLTGYGKHICDLIINRGKVRTANVSVSINSGRSIRDRFCSLQIRIESKKYYIVANEEFYVCVPHNGMKKKYTVLWKYPYTKVKAVILDSDNGDILDISETMLINPDKNIEYDSVSLYLNIPRR